MSRIPGGSAHAEYERHRSRRLSRLRQRWWAVILGALAAFAFGFVLVRIVPAALFEAFGSIVPGLGPNPFEIPVGLAVVVGAVFAVVGAWSLVRPSMAEAAWRKGASGEKLVGRHLDALRSEGLSVIHDVPLLGSRANIDHLVVSPHGVFTVETKAYKGRLAVRRRGKELWIKGRNRSHILDQTRRQAGAVAAALSAVGLGHVPVTPVLCFVDTDLPVLGSRNAGGVALTTVRRLRRLLLSREAAAVEPGDVEAAVRLLEGSSSEVVSHTRPAPQNSTPSIPKCARCGKPMVRRKRRRDGALFYGCSGFPNCRYTRAIT